MLWDSAEEEDSSDNQHANPSHAGIPASTHLVTGHLYNGAQHRPNPRADDLIRQHLPEHDCGDSLQPSAMHTQDRAQDQLSVFAESSAQQFLPEHDHLKPMHHSSQRRASHAQHLNACHFQLVQHDHAQGLDTGCSQLLQPDEDTVGSRGDDVCNDAHETSKGESAQQIRQRSLSLQQRCAAQEQQQQPQQQHGRSGVLVQDKIQTAANARQQPEQQQQQGHPVMDRHDAAQLASHAREQPEQQQQQQALYAAVMHDQAQPSSSARQQMVQQPVVLPQQQSSEAYHVHTTSQRSAQRAVDKPTQSTSQVQDRAVHGGALQSQAQHAQQAANSEAGPKTYPAATVALQRAQHIEQTAAPTGFIALFSVKLAFTRPVPQSRSSRHASKAHATAAADAPALSIPEQMHRQSQTPHPQHAILSEQEIPAQGSTAGRSHVLSNHTEPAQATHAASAKTAEHPVRAQHAQQCDHHQRPAPVQQTSWSAFRRPNPGNSSSHAVHAEQAHATKQDSNVCDRTHAMPAGVPLASTSGQFEQAKGADNTTSSSEHAVTQMPTASSLRQMPDACSRRSQRPGSLSDASRQTTNAAAPQTSSTAKDKVHLSAPGPVTRTAGLPVRPQSAGSPASVQGVHTSSQDSLNSHISRSTSLASQGSCSSTAPARRTIKLDVSGRHSVQSSGSSSHRAVHAESAQTPDRCSGSNQTSHAVHAGSSQAACQADDSRTQHISTGSMQTLGSHAQTSSSVRALQQVQALVSAPELGLRDEGSCSTLLSRDGLEQDNGRLRHALAAIEQQLGMLRQGVEQQQVGSSMQLCCAAQCCAGLCCAMLSYPRLSAIKP